MMEWFFFAIAGVMAGTVAGLFGVGGGLIIVPILVWVFNWQGFPAEFAIHTALGTSLMTICLTSLSSMHAHQQYGNVEWGVVKKLIATLMLGSFIGAVIAAYLPASQLEVFFASFVLIMAFRIWVPSVQKHYNKLNRPLALASYGSLTGMISAIVGIGGGTLIVPYLVMAGYDVKRAVGTAAACGFPIALSGAIGFIFMGQQVLLEQTTWQTGFVHWQAFAGIISTSLICARIGAKLAKTLPAELLRKLFSLLLFCVSMTFFIR